MYYTISYRILLILCSRDIENYFTLPIQTPFMRKKLFSDIHSPRDIPRETIDISYVLARLVEMSSKSSPTVARSSGLHILFFGCATSVRNNETPCVIVNWAEQMITLLARNEGYNEPREV